ncbi:hypothetical protein JCM10449v2_003599 [Rhodotorula kratochvilovae]
MSSGSDKTCLICGVETKNRCSICAKAGIDLYFCSPEHQKLVWKAHKEVCGPPFASPFTPPNLTQVEEDALRALIHVEGPMPAGVPASIASKMAQRGKYTIARALEFTSKLEEGDMETAILPLCRKVRTITDWQLRRQIGGFVGLLRMELLSAAQGDDLKLPIAREAMHTADVFTIAAQFSTVLHGAIIASPHCDLPNSALDGRLHRCVILAALVKLDPNPPKGFDAELITKSHCQLLNYVRPHLHFPGANPWDGAVSIISPLARAIGPAHGVITTGVFARNGDIASFACRTGVLPR